MLQLKWNGQGRPHFWEDVKEVREGVPWLPGRKTRVGPAREPGSRGPSVDGGRLRGMRRQRECGTRTLCAGP